MQEKNPNAIKSIALLVSSGKRFGALCVQELYFCSLQLKNENFHYSMCQPQQVQR